MAKINSSIVKKKCKKFQTIKDLIFTNTFLLVSLHKCCLHWSTVKVLIYAGGKVRVFYEQTIRVGI